MASSNRVCPLVKTGITARMGSYRGIPSPSTKDNGLAGTPCAAKRSRLRYWRALRLIYLYHFVLHHPSRSLHLYRVAPLPRARQGALAGNTSEISSLARREQIHFLAVVTDEILSCWDESWGLYRTRKTHQFPGISDRSILQRQQHHCATIPLTVKNENSV